jgi:hypothetical protein
MAIHARIVDARTLGRPSLGQLIGRYAGYTVSVLPLGFGLVWVGWDPRKQGWHDKLAGTVVVRQPRASGSGRAAPSVAGDRAARSEDLAARRTGSAPLREVRDRDEDWMPF